MKAISKFCLAIIVGVFLVGLLAEKDDKNSEFETDEADAVGDAQGSAPPPIITVLQLARDYEADTVAADRKYKGNRFKVTGSVVDINTDVSGDPYITIDGASDFHRPHFSFDRNYADQLATVKKGMKLTLVCVGKGNVFKTPMSDKCKIML